jgi:hypothetical protein
LDWPQKRGSKIFLLGGLDLSRRAAAFAAGLPPVKSTKHVQTTGCVSKARVRNPQDWFNLMQSHGIDNVFASCVSISFQMGGQTGHISTD